MALSDSRLVGLLTHEAVGVRSASLELLSGSFSTDARWLPQIFAAWDRYGAHEAFPEFPLLTHFAIPTELVSECIDRAQRMSAGRAITDRVCRCAGKLIEAISVAPPITFANHVAEIHDLKLQSKIFFRVNDQKMRARCGWIDREFSDLAETLAQNPGSILNLYEVLESQFLQGRADDVLKSAFQSLRLDLHDRLQDRLQDHLQDQVDSQESTFEQVSHVCLELATRYRMVGYEAWFVDLLDHRESSIADAASIGLSRCRTDTSLSLIADRFADYSKSGQLRSIDVLRRGRMPKTSELLRFLRAYGHGTQVQNALRTAEVLQFDYSCLEDWLEALVVVDEPSFGQLKGSLAIVEPLTESLSPADRARTMHLLRSRFKD